MGVYVVDSNFFIQAHRINYPIDIAFSFWNKVKQLADEGKIISIDKVKKEIYDKNDTLEAWCIANLPDDFFKDTSQIIAEYEQISGWAITKNDFYLPNALSEFLDADEADAYIVAFVLADPINRVVVTQEISQANRKNKIKIPDVCNAFNLSYVNTIEMFRQLAETF